MLPTRDGLSGRVTTRLLGHRTVKRPNSDCTFTVAVLVAVSVDFSGIARFTFSSTLWLTGEPEGVTWAGKACSELGQIDGSEHGCALRNDYSERVKLWEVAIAIPGIADNQKQLVA
ncbi:MAG: hypothetical protein ABR543_18645, partial [Gemmatimonadaceae bacterium]